MLRALSALLAVAAVTAQLQGRVFLDRYTPVVGATVVVRPQAGGSPVWLTVTDAKGAFRIAGIPDGVYRAEIRREGLASIVRESVELKAPFRGVYEVKMARRDGAPEALPAPPGPSAEPASLAGSVGDSRGKPLVDVRVRLARGDGTADPRIAVTGADGAFRIDGLAAGVWSVELIGPGLLPVRTPLAISGNETVSAVLAPQPAEHVASPEDLMPVEEPFPPPAAR